MRLRACTWLHAPCLLLVLAVAATASSTVPSASSAPRETLRTKPSCQITIGKSMVRSCGYIEHSDACCMAPLATTPIASTQRHLEAGPVHSNVTFTPQRGDGLYLLSHDDSCGPDHECWEVSLGRLGQLAGVPDADGHVEVQVSFMAGPKVYNVSLSTVTTVTSTSRSGAKNGQQGGALAGPECRLLRASTPVLDISGNDATLRLVPPLVGDTSAMPTVCVTFHSDQCRVDCKDFAVPADCKHSRFHQSQHCLEKPFESVLTIHNVTLFQPDPAHATIANAVSHDGPLQFHCARLHLGGCVLATPTMAVRMSLPSHPVEVAVVAYGPEWAAPLRSMLLVTIPLCLAVLLLCVLHSFFAGTYAAWRPFPVLPLHLRTGFRSDFRTELQPEEDSEECLAKPATEAQAAALRRRIFLVYCKPGGSSEQDGHVLSGAVRALGRILGAGGKTEVVDMYDDPHLLDTGAVVRAADILGDPDAILVMVLTPLLAETLRPAPVDGAAAEHMDPFRKFVVALAMGLSHAPQKTAQRVFPVSLDARHQQDFLIGVPITVVYVMPHHLKNLLQAIPGLFENAVSHSKFPAEEQKLVMYTRMYTQQKQDRSSTDVL